MVPQHQEVCAIAMSLQIQDMMAETTLLNIQKQINGVDYAAKSLTLFVRSVTKVSTLKIALRNIISQVYPMRSVPYKGRSITPKP